VVTKGDHAALNIQRGTSFSKVSVSFFKLHLTARLTPRGFFMFADTPEEPRTKGTPAAGG
jgi:hypothetical protein